MDSDIGTLDPAQITAKSDMGLYQNLFDGLLKFDDHLNVVPDIATQLPDISLDGTAYTFHLNPNARFWNGDPVTAQDFIFSFSRAAAEGQNAYGTDFDHVVGYDVVSANTDWPHHQTMLSGMSAPDDHTLIIRLISPWYQFTSELALPAAAQVVNPKVIKSEITGPDHNDANWWVSPDTAVGTGPYRLASYTPRQSIEFDAVSNWWGSPRQTVKKVMIDLIADMSQGVARYEQGGYDLVGYGGTDADLSVPDLKRIQGTSGESHQLHFINGIRTIWVQYGFLAQNPVGAIGPWPSPFAGDLQSGPAHDLRLALSLAIDRRQLVNAACAGGLSCTAATGGLITRGLKGYAGDNSDPLAKFNPQLAKQLLQSAQAAGKNVGMLTYFYDTSKDIYELSAQNLQSQWASSLGLHVDLQPVDHATFIQKYTAHDYVLFREGWQADYDHPGDWWDNLFMRDGVANGGAFSDPVIEQLVQKADAEPLNKGISDYLKANQQLEADAAYAPLLYFRGALLVKPYLVGAGSNNFTDYPWDELKILSH